MAAVSKGVICFCGQDWWYHSHGHSDFQLMIRIATRQKVLAVNSIGMRMPVPGKSQKVIRKVWRKLRSIAKLVRRPFADRDFYVMSPVTLPFYGSPWLRRISAWLVRCQVGVVAWWLGIKIPIIVVTVPTAWEVVRPMRRRCLFYNRSDKHSEFSEADAGYIRSLEAQLFRNAEQVLFASQTLMEVEQGHCAGRAYFLDHGVDLDRFMKQTYEQPLDTKALARPLIGFFGGLRSHLVDLDLLERVAREVPEAQLVLVGDAASDIEGLISLSNVHWLGQKPHDRIPAYGATFDVALMPYHRSEWIRNCNPIKLKEYLALGLRVVSTDFPAARRYSDLIEVAADDEEFIARIRKLLDEPFTEEMRRANQQRVLKTLSAGSWDDRAVELLALAENCAGGESPPLRSSN